jgi:hypothetical protein
MNRGNRTLSGSNARQLTYIVHMNLHIEININYIVHGVRLQIVVFVNDNIIVL